MGSSSNMLTSVLQFEVLIRELGSIDRLSSGAWLRNDGRVMWVKLWFESILVDSEQSLAMQQKSWSSKTKVNPNRDSCTSHQAVTTISILAYFSTKDNSPLWLVKSPPWHMNPGITRWKDEPAYPYPFSPVLDGTRATNNNDVSIISIKINVWSVVTGNGSNR